MKAAGAEATAGELMSFVSERVPSYKKVRRVAFVDEIPVALRQDPATRLVERERSGPG